MVIRHRVFHDWAKLEEKERALSLQGSVVWLRQAENFLFEAGHKRKNPEQELKCNLPRCRLPAFPPYQRSPTIQNPGRVKIVAFIEPTLKQPLRPLLFFRKEHKRLLRLFYSRITSGGAGLEAYIKNTRTRLLADYQELGLLKTAIHSACDFSLRFGQLSPKQQELRWAAAFYSEVVLPREEDIRLKFALPPVPVPIGDMMDSVFCLRDQVLGSERSPSISDQSAVESLSPSPATPQELAEIPEQESCLSILDLSDLMLPPDYVLFGLSF